MEDSANEAQALRRAALRTEKVDDHESDDLKRRDAAAAQQSRPVLGALTSNAVAAQGGEARAAADSSLTYIPPRPATGGEDGCLSLSCPRCCLTVAYSGCAALQCLGDRSSASSSGASGGSSGANSGCGACFCALCLRLFSEPASLHAHFVHPSAAHSGIGNGASVTAEQVAAFQAGMRAAVAALTGESAALRMDLLRALLGEAAAQLASVVLSAAAGTGVDATDAAAVVAEMALRQGDAATAVWGCNALAATHVDDIQLFIDAGGAAAIVAAMHTHTTIAAVAASGLNGLYKLTIGADEHAQSLIDAGGIAPIVAALEAHPSNTAIVTRGCQALKLLACGTDEQSQAVVDAGGHSAIIAALHAHLTDAALAVICCDGLRHIASGSDELCHSVAAAGGVAAIVAALNAHPTDADVAAAGCNGLSSIASGSNELSHSVAAAGGVAAVSAALNAHLTDAAVAAAGCASLWHITSEEEQGQDVIGLVTSAMRFHPTTAAVAALGCAALHKLLADVNAVSPVLIDLVVGAMQAHPADTSVAGYGCHALHTFAAGSNEKRQAVINAGGAAAIVTAIMDASAFAPGCLALNNIASGSEEQRQVVVDVGGVAVILRVLKAHNPDQDIGIAAEWGCNVLFRVAAGSADRTQAIVHAGGIETVVALLQATCDRDDSVVLADSDDSVVLADSSQSLASLAASCCRLLGEMAVGSDENARAIAAAGGVAAITDALIEFCDNDDDFDYEWVSRLLGDIADGLDGLPLRDAVAAIVKVLEAVGEDHIAVVEWSCYTLSVLAARSEAHVDAIVAAGGVAAIAVALQCGWDEDDDDDEKAKNVAEWGCLALADIATSSEQHMLAVVAAGGVTALASSLDSYPDDAAIAEWGCRALASIASCCDARQLARIGAAAPYGAAAVINVLCEHADDSDVCESGEAALRLWPEALLDATRTL